MKVKGHNYRTVWLESNKANEPLSVYMIDQNLLPFKFKIQKCPGYLDTCEAIKIMTIRGAGAIGAAAGFAMAQAFVEAPEENFWQWIKEAKKNIESTRPTAQNLFYAIDKVHNAAKNSTNPRTAAALAADAIAEEDIKNCLKIGEYGNTLIQHNFNIETHCNAGWLAFVDYGSALSPIYVAHRSGKRVHVYVDETRPKGQGAKLTAWELQNEGIPYLVIPDNAGAYLMSRGNVDMMIVGADRIAANGDVANKIGTLEKAVCAYEFGVPFYVAAPTSTIDLVCKTGKYIPIEKRDADEVLRQTGLTKNGFLETVLVCAPGSKVANIAFDVTPAKYITGIITDKGIIKPCEEEISKLFS